MATFPQIWSHWRLLCGLKILRFLIRFENESNFFDHQIAPSIVIDYREYGPIMASFSFILVASPFEKQLQLQFQQYKLN